MKYNSNNKRCADLVPTVDRYQKKRGGYSTFLVVRCHHCKSKIFAYQKDGPGPLKRSYLNRVRYSAEHFRRVLPPVKGKSGSQYDDGFHCASCGINLATLDTHSDGRRALFWHENAIEVWDLGCPVQGNQVTQFFEPQSKVTKWPLADVACKEA